MTKGSLIIEATGQLRVVWPHDELSTSLELASQGFDAVPFCVAHNDQGTTYAKRPVGASPLELYGSQMLRRCEKNEV